MAAVIRVTVIRIRQLITDDNGSRWRVEALFDVIEPKELALGNHIQRAVVHRDTIGLIEAAGDYHNAISFVVAVAIDDRVDLARPRSDEHRPSRAERHLSRVPDAVSEYSDVKTRGNHPLVGRLCPETAGSCQARKEGDAPECSDSERL